MGMNGKQITIEGKVLRVARPHACEQQEWFEDVENPEALIDALQKSKDRPDILTFWQRLPDTSPNIPIKWNRSRSPRFRLRAIPSGGRNKLIERPETRFGKRKKRALRSGWQVLMTLFVRGMTSIFNETPIRQGRRFLHYGKDFETVKREFSRFLFREEIFGAYIGEELVGFIMVGDAGKYACLGQIISKIAFRDLAPTNALLAKVIERCAEKGFPYLVYAYWLDDSLGDFKRSNGFQKFDLPRYFVPLTNKGKLALKLGVHRGWKKALPKEIKKALKKLRRGWYDMRCGLANECTSR